ncbi:hypothetical protein H5410_009423 [Solanum commersonii]|uniref:Uncharacterized protein n=1 Tax=Solanum commersonii TaxID=4109 RepID=A0A9J6AHU1_SOLCO|nr:hypothetical protein H5410_009423 [Solanum commersonii]
MYFTTNHFEGTKCTPSTSSFLTIQTNKKYWFTYFTSKVVLCRLIFWFAYIICGRPKRVLHSLKESVLRFALVHSSVSFKIVDIEKSIFVISANLRISPVWFIRFCSLSCNEDDLLCTRASPSPLPLLSSGFGLHLSSLNKLNANDGSFKLSGYISGPDVYTVKISIQVFKGRIHKLLNNTAMSFDSPLTLSYELENMASIGGIDPWDVCSSGPSEYHYD